MPAPVALADHPLILPWLPSDERYVVIGHERMRRSAARTDGYEIECQFAALTPEGNSSRQVAVWVPLEQLPLLRPGSLFERKTIIGRANGLNERQATSLRATAMCEFDHSGPGRYLAQGHRPIGAPRLSSTLVAATATVGEHGGRRVYLRSGELLRFYFGAISWLADAFMSATHSPPGTGLVNLEETGTREPGVMQIAPIAGLTDRSSALHLAMLLSSPDLMEMWRSAAEAYLVMATRDDSSFSVPPLTLAPGRHSLSLAGHTTTVRLDPAGVNEERAFVALSIMSDYRPAPFRRLIIKLPHGMGEGDLDDSEGPEPATRYRTVIAPDAALESRRRPGVSLGQVSPHPESVRRAFPQLGRVEVKYEVQRQIRRGGERQTDWRQRPVESLSALVRGSDLKVGGVVLRPGPSYRAAAPERGPGPTETLLDRRSAEAGQFEPFDRNALSYPVSVFVSAFSRLSFHQSGRLVGHDPVRTQGGKVIVSQAVV